MTHPSGIRQLLHGHGPDRRGGYLDTVSGAEITPLSQDWIGYLVGDRMLRVAVEYGVGALIVWGVDREWDDGTTTRDADVAAVRATCTRLAAFRGTKLDWVRDF